MTYCITISVIRYCRDSNKWYKVKRYVDLDDNLNLIENNWLVVVLVATIIRIQGRVLYYFNDFERNDKLLHFKSDFEQRFGLLNTQKNYSGTYLLI